MRNVAEHIKSVLINQWEESPFSNPFMYDVDASEAIVRGALIAGDEEVLNRLIEDIRIFFRLPVDNEQSYCLRFEQVDEEGKPRFTRMRDHEQVTLSEEQINTLEVEELLAEDEIKAWAPRFDIPTYEEVTGK